MWILSGFLNGVGFCIMGGEVIQNTVGDENWMLDPRVQNVKKCTALLSVFWPFAMILFLKLIV